MKSTVKTSRSNYPTNRLAVSQNKPNNLLHGGQAKLKVDFVFCRSNHKKINLNPKLINNGWLVPTVSLFDYYNIPICRWHNKYRIHIYN